MICFTGRSDIEFLLYRRETRLAAFAWRFRKIHAFMNCKSSVMVTSSPTRRPPLSSAAFQVRPKSLRLILVVADTPTRVLPHGSFAGGVGPSAEKTTLR